MAAILDNDKIYELVRFKAVGEVIFGHGIAVKGAGGKDADQVQRWMMDAASLDDLRAQMSPATDVVWRPATTSPWKDANRQSLTEFLRLVDGSDPQNPPVSFKEGANIYAKVNCKHITGLASVPRPIPLPDTLDPDPNGGNQVGTGTSQVGRDTGGYNGPTGYVHTWFDSSLTSWEHWVLLPGYTSPTSSYPNRLAAIRKPEDFASFFDTKMWNTSCTWVVARAGYYTKLPTPL